MLHFALHIDCGLWAGGCLMAATSDLVTHLTHLGVLGDRRTTFELRVMRRPIRTA